MSEYWTKDIIEINYNQSLVQRKNVLRKTNTRKLMDWRKIAIANGSYYHDNNIEFSYDEIREELGKREHIRNKPEGEEFRRKIAKGRNPRPRGRIR